MKKLLAVIAGVLVAVTVIVIIQWIGFKIDPLPEGTSFSDLDSIKTAVRSMSVGMLLISMASHVIGSLAGGVVVGRILKSDTMNVGLTLGIVLTALAMIMMVVLDPEEYFYFDCMMYIPGAMFGANYTSKL